MILCKWEECVNYNKSYAVGAAVVSTCALCSEMKRQDLCTCDKGEKKVSVKKRTPKKPSTKKKGK